MADVAVRHHSEDALEARSVKVLTREARIADDDDLAQVMQLRVHPELVGLALDREALLRLLLG